MTTARRILADQNQRPAGAAPADVVLCTRGAGVTTTSTWLVYARAFHDRLWREGNVPLVLLRWELLGDRDPLEAADRLADVVKESR